MKQCEVCGTALQGKQQRFCGIRCRNVSAGRISKRRYQVPDRETLARLYLLPPDGEGKSLSEIGTMFGTTDVTAGSWIKEHGLTQDARLRLSYHQRQHPKQRIPVPPKQELENLYRMPPDGEGLSQDEVAERYGVERQTARRWLKEYGLLERHSERHSLRMSGQNNPAFHKGNTTRYLRNQLVKRDGLKQCVWCGATDQIQVHHIDHNRENNGLENLILLCGYCNRLEAQLWALVNQNRADVEVEKGKITITFKHNEGEI